MSDRCYTDFHLFQICLASVDYIFPRRTRINTDFYSVYSVFSVDFFFTRKVTDVRKRTRRILFIIGT